MARIIAPELHVANLLLLVEIDSLDLVHASLDIGLCVQHLLGGYVTESERDETNQP